jgi:large subunit ribosomal protein L1
MKKLNRRIQDNKNKITKSLYSIEEALNLLKKTATAKFIETVELHINLKTGLNQIRNTVILPNATGHKILIAVLAPENLINKSLKDEADIIGNDDLIQEIQKGNINFNLLITVPEMMPKLAKLGKILGPKGLMPSPKSGTVTNNLFDTIKEFKKGKFEYKTDKNGILHIAFGKSDLAIEKLKENLIFLYSKIQQSKPIGIKGLFIKSIFICNTMGPSIPIDIKSFE